MLPACAVFDLNDGCPGPLDAWRQEPKAYTPPQTAQKVALEFLSLSLDDPWYRHLPSGGTPVGAKIYQRSYSAQCTSYDVAARAKKVSQYQYRAPGEWFAEAYPAYYQPNTDGTCDHHYLGTIDAAAKGWFDTNVDPVVGSR